MYVLDLDDSIFDTRWFKEFFLDVLGNTWRNKAMLMEMMDLSKEYNDGIFDFKKWLSLCWISENEFELIWQRAHSFVYDDFIEFASRNKNNIIILTYGDRYFQEKKIKRSWIERYINSYYITKEKNKKNDLINIYNKCKEKLVYIDDRVFVKQNDFDFDIDIFRFSRTNNAQLTNLAYI